MPGRKDRDHPLASYMTPYTSYRSGVNSADAAGFPSANDIDFSRAVDAVNNLLYVTAVRTAGTGQLTIELWQNPGGSLAAQWRKVNEATLDNLGEVRFEALYGVPYRIRAANVPAGSTWTLHESHSEYEA